MSDEPRTFRDKVYETMTGLAVAVESIILDHIDEDYTPAIMNAIDEHVAALQPAIDEALDDLVVLATEAVYEEMHDDGTGDYEADDEDDSW